PPQGQTSRTVWQVPSCADSSHCSRYPPRRHPLLQPVPPHGDEKTRPPKIGRTRSTPAPRPGRKTVRRTPSAATPPCSIHTQRRGPIGLESLRRIDSSTP